MNREWIEQYASVSIDLHYAGNQFDRAQRYLTERRLQAAEDAIQRGLDGLARALENMPKIAEESEALTAEV